MDNEKIKIGLKQLIYLSIIFSIVFPILIMTVVLKQNINYIIAVYALLSVFILQLRLGILEKF